MQHEKLHLWLIHVEEVLAANQKWFDSFMTKRTTHSEIIVVGSSSKEDK